MNSGNQGTPPRRPRRKLMLPPRLPPITALILFLNGTVLSRVLTKLTTKVSMKSSSGAMGGSPFAEKSLLFVFGLPIALKGETRL